VTFESSGRSRAGIPDKWISTLKVVISYKYQNNIRKFEFGFNNREVGPSYSGEFSVIPFTSGGPTSDQLFHDQIRPLMDEIVMAFAKALDSP